MKRSKKNIKKEISKKEIEEDIRVVCSYLEFYDKNGYFPFEKKKKK